MSQCEYCGAEYEQVRRTQRFCCEPCQRAWWKENRKEHGLSYTFTCKNCGKEYQTVHKDRDQYCSRECAYEDIESWRITYKKPLEKLTCRSCGIEYEGRTTYSNGYCSDECRERGIPLICEYCGSNFYNTLPFTKYCSQDCQYQAMLQMHRDQYEPVEAFVAVCSLCGNEYETNRTQSRYCSAECRDFVDRQQKYAAQQEYINRLKDAFVAPVDRIEIFKRDNWMCQICGSHVSPHAKFPDPYSPTLDHVIPLARGGTHEPVNVQLAHFICNSYKRDIMPGAGQKAGIDTPQPCGQCHARMRE